MTVCDARGLRALEAENGNLKRLLAEAMLDNAALSERLKIMVGERRRFGYRRLAILLRREACW